MTIQGDLRRPWAAGMRELVMLHLRQLGTASVDELAQSIGQSPAAIGPRLTELAQLQQVRSWSVIPRGKRGRPRKIWTIQD